jgi:RND family efflux transporter MFP subunit
MDSSSIKASFNKYSRQLVTLTMALIALVCIWWLWNYYQIAPWTRDGRLRADVVKVAPDVSGLVTEILVSDNQPVKRGQKLFVIDQERYRLALEDAQAKVSSAKAALDEIMREDVRNRRLGTLVSKEQSEQTTSRTQQLREDFNQAISNRKLAQLNLERTVVKASVNGIVSNFSLQPGDYAATGQQIFALIDTDTLRVEGYFEETKLPYIQVGSQAIIRLMGERANICGHIESIAPGIEDRERNPSANQLPNINPTFNWVRLAQRIPVRIAIDHVPEKMRLISGRTATVKIMQHQHTEAEKTC